MIPASPTNYSGIHDACHTLTQGNLKKPKQNSDKRTLKRIIKPRGRDLTWETIMLSPYAFICNLLVATNCQTGYSVFIHNNAARGNSQQTSIRETAFNYRCVVSLNMATLSLLPRHAHKGTLSTASVPNCQLMSVTLFYLPRRSCCSSLQGTPRNWCFKTNSSLRGKGPTTAEV